MKKLLAILLVLMMLLSMGLIAPAQAEEVSEKPFYLVNWAGKGSGYPYIYGMPYFWAYPMGPDATEGKVAWQDVSDIPQLAKDLKAQFDSQPVRGSDEAVL